MREATGRSASIGEANRGGGGTYTVNMKKPSNGSAKLRLIIILAAALAAGSGLWVGARMSAPDAPVNAASTQNALLFPAPRELPPFALDAGDGGQLDNAALKGRWSLIFIGFTHCPDICPTTLATLGALQKVATDVSPALQVVFVSVDPERDSADRAAEYARFFVPDALAATADHPRLEAFTRSLGMIYVKTAMEDGDYSVDHSARIAILDPQARQVGMFSPPLDIAQMASDLHQLAGR